MSMSILLLLGQILFKLCCSTIVYTTSALQPHYVAIAHQRTLSSTLVNPDCMCMTELYTTLIDVYYCYAVKCGALTGVVGASVQVAFDDRQPALEGTTVSFSCPPGLVLAGPNTTTCMENGEWEPDPTNIKCKGHLCYCFLDNTIKISLLYIQLIVVCL